MVREWVPVFLVMDFSATALPICVKFCTAFQPHLGQVFSHFGGIALATAEYWASTGAIWHDMLLAEALVTKSFLRKVLAIEVNCSGLRVSF